MVCAKKASEPATRRLRFAVHPIISRRKFYAAKITDLGNAEKMAKGIERMTLACMGNLNLENF